MVPGSAAAIAAAKGADNAKKTRGDDLPVRMWSKMDATPYGHFERVADNATPSPGALVSTTGLRVLGDHYNVPKVTSKKIVPR